MTELIGVWHLWVDGKLADTLMLWGHPIYVWGRIGKLLQAIAIIGAILDIIGPARIHGFGQTISTYAFQRKGKHALGQALSLLTDWNRVLWTTADAGLQHGLRDSAPNRWIVYLHGLQILAIFAYLCLLAYSEFFKVTHSLDLSVALSIAVALIAIGVYIWAAAYVTVALVGLLGTIGLLVDILVIRPLAWIFSQPGLEIFLKSLLVIAALIGTHFDFLAS